MYDHSLKRNLTDEEVMYLHFGEGPRPKSLGPDPVAVAAANYAKDHKATRGRLKRMFKYFRNKKVCVRYEYNDSLGGHHVREIRVVYDSFEIKGEASSTDWTFILYNGKDAVFYQDFHCGWEFVGLGKLKYVAGPTCHFDIRKV